MKSSLTFLPSGRVRLNSSPPKYLGKIYQNTLFKSVKEENVFRRCRAVGINAELLENPPLPFRFIEVTLIHSDGSIERLRTSRDFILRNGRRFQFNGYEPQVGLELSLWDNKDVIQRQLSLFEDA